MRHFLNLRLSRVAVLVALVVACGGDGGGTAPDNTIASVDISGAPAAPVAASSYVQLTANVRNAAGSPLTGRALMWRSGDPLIARVDQSGLVLTMDGGTTMITVRVEGKTAGTTITVAPLGVSKVTVSPATPKLYVNNTLQMRADVKDSKGRLLTGHAVAWRSSDVAKATIDGNGLVQALAPGTTTITANSDGIAGNAVVTVIPTAFVDWSGAADWPTFQGNASHTGYVPVTVDPAVFNVRWVVDLGPDGLNPVTAADGKVFVSTNRHFLAVLDERTGAQQWAYDFGSVDVTNPPAYGDGGVFVASGGYGNGYFWGFDANTGVIRFRNSLGSQAERYYAPVVVDQTVFVGGGQYGGMNAFASADGVQKWHATLDQNYNFTPAVRNGLAYAYSGVSTPRLSVVDAATGAVAYEIADPNFVFYTYSLDDTPVLGALDDAIVTQAGRLVVFDLANHRVKWEQAGSYGGTVAVAHGVIYVSNGAGLSAIRESDGAPLWNWVSDVSGRLGALIVTDNVIFVTAPNNAYAIDLRTHAPVWTFNGGHLTLTKDGALLVAQSNGQLVAFDLK
jgi:outer membrane protein assembly factor BamB